MGMKTILRFMQQCDTKISVISLGDRVIDMADTTGLYYLHLQVKEMLNFS